MFKHNMETTKEHFDLWWKRENKRPIISIYYPFTKFVYKDINEYTDCEMNIRLFTEEHRRKTFLSDCIPDISSYLGPGSLATFLGAEPVYSDATIWYDSTIDSPDCIFEYIKNPAKWYEWSLNATRKYVNEIAEFRTSMPDLEQNLDILSAIISPENLLMMLIDEKPLVMELLEQLHGFWKKAFFAHANALMDKDGYTSYGHYNIIGKGYTSVLQSDISIMLSPDMYDEFEAPYLLRQSEELDNILYHLDGPGAIRHLDTILSIGKIAAVQWVPGAGQPDNYDESWYPLYDRILKSGKGIYVHLAKENVMPFLDRFGSKGVFIGTTVKHINEEMALLEKIDKKF
ncbi:MAG: hypothetical protein JXQ23_08410 [Clostridia bacterium]|nr:hypothetical protein [Clostridia bacterium]